MDDFFQRGCKFYRKNKLKYEIFNNNKKFIKKMFFSVITKDLHWEILSKNIRTFLKDENGLKMKNFNIIGVY